MKDNKILWLWLIHALEGRSQRISKIHGYFGSIEKAYAADGACLAELRFLNDKDILALSDKSTENAEATTRFCLSKGIDIITYDDEMYPPELKEIHGYPGVLFAYGNVTEAFKRPRIAVVGTRDCTSYGTVATSLFSGAIAKAGFTVVTGIADGVDATAISSALKVGGSVIAVLPGGHTRTQLSTNYKFKEVIKNGVILSEHLPDTEVYRYSYHERNRLLSGLSLGVIVTQAPEKSGALITARYAVEQNRDLFAVVANIDMLQSKGSNSLIQEGAVPLVDYKDVLNYYSISLGDRIKTDITVEPVEIKEPDKTEMDEMVHDYQRVAAHHLTDDEQRVFQYIGLLETDIDSIIDKSELPVAVVMTALSSLESMGAITACPGNKYKINIT